MDRNTMPPESSVPTLEAIAKFSAALFHVLEEDHGIPLLPLSSLQAAKLNKGLLPLLPVTPDVDRPSTFQARFSDRAGRCARAFGLGEVGFDCCQAGWWTGIRLQLRRIGGRAVAGARPARIRRVVRRCRGSRRVGAARRCRAGCRRPLRCGGGGSSGTRTRRDSGTDGRGAGHGRFRAPSASGSRTHDGSRSARDGRALHRRPWAGDRGRAGQDKPLQPSVITRAPGAEVPATKA